MKHVELVTILDRWENSKLPGFDAQLLMAPPIRVEEARKADVDSAVPSAVLLLFTPGKRGESELIFIRRTEYGGVHSGQISFPGGKVEPEDKDIIHTAIRETEEEIGIHRGEIQLCGQLSPLYIPPSHFMVYPFVGYMNGTPLFKPDPAEVDEVLNIPLAQLLDNSCQTSMTVNSSRYGKMKVPCYSYGHHHVWGATAMILSEAIYVLRKLDSISPGS